MPRFLFKDAKVVLASQNELATGLSVLVEADRIAAVTRNPIEPGDARLFAGAGRQQDNRQIGKRRIGPHSAQ